MELSNIDECANLTTGEYFIQSLWKYGQEKVPVHFHFVESEIDCDTLTVFLHGARSKPIFPYYNGISLSRKHPSSHFLLISDPLLSLDIDMTLSWYTSPHNEQQIFQVISQIVENIKVSKSVKKILFLGGSGAGLALMNLNKFFSGAFFFIWNPQTIIHDYYPGHVRKWKEVTKLSHNSDKYESPPPSLVNLNSKQFFSDQSNKFFILQLYCDSYHIEKHMTPFCEEMLGHDKFLLDDKFSEYVLPNILIHIGRWAEPMIVDGKERGHIAVSGTLISQLIGDFIESEDPFKQFDTKYFGNWNIT
jgi:hypothetical protein